MSMKVMILHAIVLTTIDVSVAGTDAGLSRAPFVRSSYLTVRDGTRLAVDVWLPGNVSMTGNLPTIVEFTRYWRATRQASGGSSELSPTIRYFTAAGYAVAIADMRGTGASFGSRTTEFSDAEVRDYGEIIDWLAKSPWSNGRVATLGTSYLGNAAELAAIPARPALRALVPRFSDFSEYRHAVRPGGILNAVIAKAWVSATAALDRNDPCAAFGQDNACRQKDRSTIGAEPVDGNDLLLRRAVEEHAGNADLASIVERLTYSDDPFAGPGSPGVTLDYVSPSRRWPAIDRAEVPAFHWASWFDGGTAEGVLTRFMTYKTPISVIIGAWNHGGTSSANPFPDSRVEAPPDPSVAAQFAEIRRFLDPLLKPELRIKLAVTRQVRYFTIGQNQWHTTTTWPPKHVKEQRWYFSDSGEFSPSPPEKHSGQDRYRVDFTTTTGTRNRWHTQLGTYVQYPDRRAEDLKLLTYTSRPLGHDVEVTGTPVAYIEMTSTTPDGSLFVYLEDLAPDGRVTYLSEGEIRLLFSGNVSQTAGYTYVGPAHSFTAIEAHPFPQGKSAILEFSLNPISVVVPSGHCIRVALAGADAGTFERLPSDQTTPIYEVQRNSVTPSSISLPLRRIIPRT